MDVVSVTDDVTATTTSATPSQTIDSQVQPTTSVADVTRVSHNVSNTSVTAADVVSVIVDVTATTTSAPTSTSSEPLPTLSEALDLKVVNTASTTIGADVVSIADDVTSTIPAGVTSSVNVTTGLSSLSTLTTSSVFNFELGSTVDDVVTVSEVLLANNVTSSATDDTTSTPSLESVLVHASSIDLVSSHADDIDDSNVETTTPIESFDLFEVKVNPIKIADEIIQPTPVVAASSDFFQDFRKPSTTPVYHNKEVANASFELDLSLVGLDVQPSTEVSTLSSVATLHDFNNETEQIAVDMEPKSAQLKSR